MFNSQVLDRCPLPPLPQAKLTTRPPFISFLPDHHLPYIVPAVVYWVIGLFSRLGDLSSSLTYRSDISLH